VDALSYNSVLLKLRAHYDPEGVHSTKSSSQHYYYTDLGLLKREALKHHPKIRKLLDQLWEASDKDGNGNLDKEEYMTMCRKVYKAVVDDSDDPEAAAERARIAEEDWAADAQGHDHLDYKRFTRAWFQLADHWTHDLNVNAYCRFLGDIKETVTREDHGHFKWKLDKNIRLMEMHHSDPEDEDEAIAAAPLVLEVAPQSERPKVAPVVKEKTKRARIVAKNPNFKKSAKAKSAAPSSAVVLAEASDLTRNHGKARVHSRNGLILGSTVPPPRGWNAKLSNEWGISFTRIRVESEGSELAERTRDMGVRGSIDGSMVESQSQQHRAWAMMARQGRAQTAAARQQRYLFDPYGSTASAIGFPPYAGDGSGDGGGGSSGGGSGGGDGNGGNAPFDAQFWELQQQYSQPYTQQPSSVYGDPSTPVVSRDDGNSLLQMQLSIAQQQATPAASASQHNPVSPSQGSVQQYFQPSLDNKTSGDARPYTAPHPGGWQSAAHRPPVPFDLVSGAAGGGFEWYEPQLPRSPTSHSSSLLPTEFLMSTDGSSAAEAATSWDAKHMIPHGTTRPSTSHLMTSSYTSNTGMEGEGDERVVLWSDTSPVRPSTTGGQRRVLAGTQQYFPGRSGDLLDGGGSSIQQMGSIIMDKLVKTEKRRRKRRSKKKKNKDKDKDKNATVADVEMYLRRPMTAPNVRHELQTPSTIDVDRPSPVKKRGDTKLSSKTRRRPHTREGRRRSGRLKSRSRSSSPSAKEGAKPTGRSIDERTSRMRQRRSDDVSLPTTPRLLRPIVRPKTTGGVRQKRESSMFGVQVTSGSLFKASVADLQRPSSSSIFSSSKMLSSEMSYLRSRMGDAASEVLGAELSSKGRRSGKKGKDGNGRGRRKRDDGDGAAAAALAAAPAAAGVEATLNEQHFTKGDFIVSEGGIDYSSANDNRDLDGGSMIEDFEAPSVGGSAVGGGRRDGAVLHGGSSSSLQQPYYLDHESMKGLPLKARKLLNKYSGYDPMESLTEASLSISSMSVFSGPRSRSGGSRRRFRRKKRKKGPGIRRSKKAGVGLRMRGKRGGGSGGVGGDGGVGMLLGASALLPPSSSVEDKSFVHGRKNFGVVPEHKRTIRLLNLREACSKDDILGVMLGMGASVSLKDITLSDVSSKTRQRRAWIQFPRFADFKLALRMLGICNRADMKATLSSRKATWKTHTGSKKAITTPSSNPALDLLWNTQEMAEALLETEDDYVFLRARLNPLAKLKVPEVFAGAH
jgi:hypothetical protein